MSAVSIRERHLALAVPLAKSPDEAIAIAERFMRWTGSTESGARPSAPLTQAAEAAVGNGGAPVPDSAAGGAIRKDALPAEAVSPFPAPAGPLTPAVEPIPGSSNGRTPGFDPGNEGSTPSPGAIHAGLSPTQAAVRAQIEAEGEPLFTRKRGRKCPWTVGELDALRQAYLTEPDVLLVARRFGITKNRLYNMATTYGWSRQQVEPRVEVPEPGAVVMPVDDAKRWPLPRIAIVKTAWKAGKSVNDIAEEATRSGYRTTPAQVLAAVAQLGLTNDPDRIAARARRA